MSHFSKVPVRFLPQNEELLKSQYAGSTMGGTDMDPSRETVAVVYMEPTYHRAPDRVNGNELFRRYPNGQLDVEAAKQTIIDAIHKVKDKGPLTSLEVVALSVLFPTVFAEHFGIVDPTAVDSIRAVQLKILPHEAMAIAHGVAAHLAEEENWNAGQGGGSVPGRSITRV